MLPSIPSTLRLPRGSANIGNAKMNQHPGSVREITTDYSNPLHGRQSGHLNGRISGGNMSYSPEIFHHTHALPESVIYYSKCPEELSTEFMATDEFISNDETSSHSNYTSQTGTTEPPRFYELFQSSEIELKQTSKISDDFHYVFNKCNATKQEHSSTKNDEYPKFIQKIKSTCRFKNERKVPGNILLITSHDALKPQFMDVGVQANPVIHRNVSQQTYINCRNGLIETDETNEEHFNGKRKFDCKANCKKRQSAVQSMHLPVGNINFSDVVGLSEAKIVIRETFFLPLSHPHLFNSYHGLMKRRCRCLLYGPPGTGKTLLAQAIAAELEANLFYVSCASILSSYIGESEKNVKELFEYVLEEHTPSVIFFDEIDSVCRKRNDGESEHSRRLKTELLKYIEYPAIEESQVYILSATNCPWDLDPAFLRRFQRQIYISLPDRATRQLIISKHLGNLNSMFNEDDWNEILNKTEGFSGSDLIHFVDIAFAQPNREILRATHWRCYDGDHVTPCDSSMPDAFPASIDDIPPEKVTARHVTLQDFLHAAQNTPKTVTREHVQQFEQFKQQCSINYS